MLNTEIFILKLFYLASIVAFEDGNRSSPISIQKVTSLNHKIFHYSVKSAIFVANWSRGTKTKLSSTKLSEVFSCFRSDVFEKFHVYTACVLSPYVDIEKHHWVFRVT